MQVKLKKFIPGKNAFGNLQWTDGPSDNQKDNNFVLAENCVSDMNFVYLHLEHLNLQPT